MKKVAMALCAIGVLAGCGPRPLTAAEQRTQAHKQAVERKQEKAKERQDRIAARRAQAQQQAAEQAQRRQDALAEHEKRAAVYRQQQLAKRPLPVGVVQVDSSEFLVENAHLANGRYLCSGPVVNADNSKVDETGANDVSSIHKWDATHVQYTCLQPVRKYRDAGFRP